MQRPVIWTGETSCRQVEISLDGGRMGKNRRRIKMSPKIIYIVTFALKMGATCAHGCHIYQVINHISTGLVYI